MRQKPQREDRPPHESQSRLGSVEEEENKYNKNMISDLDAEERFLAGELTMVAVLGAQRDRLRRRVAELEEELAQVGIWGLGFRVLGI